MSDKNKQIKEVEHDLILQKSTRLSDIWWKNEI